MMRGTALGLFLVTLAGCTDNVTDLPGVEIPENRGTEVVTNETVALFAPLAWSPDGTEIYFQATSPARLMAVQLAGGTRELDGPRDDYVDIEASPDGENIFFSADLQGGSRSVYRISTNGGNATVLTSSASAVLATRQADGHLAVPSRTGEVVAFTALPDSILLLDVTTGQRRHLANGCERIVTFSPNNQSLLCQTGGGGAGAHFVINVANGAVEPIAVLPVIDTRALFINWNSNGIQAMYETPLGFALWDVTTQQSRLAWNVPLRQGIALDRLNGEWSADGKYVAFWLHECIRRQGLSTCLEGQSLLYIADPGNGRSALIAVAHGAEGGTAIAFSPTTDRVAYIFDGKIYTQPVVIP